jgi:hypothetical protein
MTMTWAVSSRADIGRVMTPDLLVPDFRRRIPSRKSNRARNRRVPPCGFLGSRSRFGGFWRSSQQQWSDLFDRLLEL